MKKILAQKYLCNFSLFRSAPDSWAIKQLFPIVPIHRLDEIPTDFATLVDVTCDSDGKIDKFVDLKKSFIMDCYYNHKFKKWIPVKLTANNSTVRLATNNDLFRLEKNKY